MRQETTAQRVVITEQGEHHHAASRDRTRLAHLPDAAKIAEELEQLDTDQERERYC